MQSSEYFVWGAERTALDLGTISLPVPIALWGLVAAVVIFFWGFKRLAPDRDSKSNKGEVPEPEGWKVLGLAVGSLVFGQLIFLIFPSPRFEQIGPIQVQWYGILFATAFLVGYFIERRMYMAAGRTQEELEKLFTYVLIATIVGARLGHIIFYDPGFYLRNPAEIIAIWHGGLASHGAAIGIILAMYLYVRKVKNMTFLWLADRVVVVVAIAGAFIRTGNFVNSEIVGQPAELPWAVIFTRIDMLPRHPTMLYEAVLCIITFVVLWVMYKRYDQKPPEGSLFGTFLTLLFSGRFLLEFTKIPQADFAASWPINMGQLLSLPLIAIGIWLLVKKVHWSKSSA